MKEQTCCCPHFPPAQQTQNCMCWVVVGSFWYAAAEEPEAFLSPHSLLQYHCQNKWTFGDALFLLWHLTTITCIYQALFCCLLSHIHLQFALPQSLTANLLRKCIPWAALPRGHWKQCLWLLASFLHYLSFTHPTTFHLIWSTCRHSLFGDLACWITSNAHSLSLFT